MNNDAYVILFYGKTGESEITVINVFFNIIKGINLNDNFRYIFIVESKHQRSQAKSLIDDFIYII